MGQSLQERAIPERRLQVVVPELPTIACLLPLLPVREIFHTGSLNFAMACTNGRVYPSRPYRPSQIRLSYMGRDGNGIETNEFDVAGITGLCVARGSLPTANSLP
jgi:hypothetical protein